MRIEHIALWTNDLERLKSFYTGFFHGKAGEKYENKGKQFESYFITFEGGARLELMSKTGWTEAASNPRHGGYAHAAFSVGSKEKVIELTERLRNQGYPVVSEPRVTGDGYFESCVADPDGNWIEITV